MSLVLALLSTLHDLEQDPNHPFSLSFLFCATGIIDPPCSRLRVGEGFVSSGALCTREDRPLAGQPALKTGIPSTGWWLWRAPDTRPRSQRARLQIPAAPVRL